MDEVAHTTLLPFKTHREIAQRKPVLAQDTLLNFGMVLADRHNPEHKNYVFAVAGFSDSVAGLDHLTRQEMRLRQRVGRDRGSKMVVLPPRLNDEPKKWPLGGHRTQGGEG